MTDVQVAKELFNKLEDINPLAFKDQRQVAHALIATALAARERAVLEDAIVLLKRRAEHYTGTRDVHTITRDIQFNEVMGCIETLEQCQQAEGVKP